LRRGAFHSYATSVQRPDSLAKVEQLPEAHSDVEDADARDRAAHPSGRNKTLQPVTGLARGHQQKIIIGPIAETPPAVRHPGQYGQHDADFKTQDDVEGYR